MLLWLMNLGFAGGSAVTDIWTVQSNNAGTWSVQSNNSSTWSVQ